MYENKTHGQEIQSVIESVKKRFIEPCEKRFRNDFLLIFIDSDTRNIASACLMSLFQGLTRCWA